MFVLEAMKEVHYFMISFEAGDRSYTTGIPKTVMKDQDSIVHLTWRVSPAPRDLLLTEIPL